MNILHVCGTKRLSGLELLAYDLVKRMKQDGHFVSIAAREGYGLAKLAENDDISTINYQGGISRLWYPMQVRNFILRNKIDIVHFHQLRLLKRLLPFLPSGTGRPAYLFTDAAPHKKRIATRYIKNILDQVDLLMVCSGSHKQVSANALDYPEHRITVLENGVDIEKFHPPQDKQEQIKLREKYNIPQELPCIALIGRIDESKGQDTLIEAARLMINEGRKFRIEICGELNNVAKSGLPFVRKIKDMVANSFFDGCINLRGFVDEIPAFLRAIDIQVVPSVREPFGLVAAEALATELSVVVSAVGALPVIVQNGKCGLVVEPSSPEKLAAAIGEILDYRDKGIAMGKLGRKRVLKYYSLDKHLTGLYALYKQTKDNIR